MAIIVIKDLLESVDLDHQAMLAISGGARTRGRTTFLGGTTFPRTSIISYRPRRPLGSTLQK